MRIPGGIGATLTLAALSLPGAAAAESTTGSPGSENAPGGRGDQTRPGNRGDLGSQGFDPRPWFATKLQVRPRPVTAGEPAVVFGTGWIPPFTCKKKGRVKVSIKTKGDERRKLGELDPYGGGIRIGTGSTEIPFSGDRERGRPAKQLPFKPGFSLANITGSLTVPEETKGGTATLRAEQDLYFRIPIFGDCVKLGIGTSDRTTVKVLPAKFDSKVITDLRLLNSGPSQGGPVKLLWKLGRAGRARVTLFHRFTTRLDVPVATLFDGSRTAGDNDHTFPLAFDGKPLPAGGYRLRVELEDAESAARAKTRRPTPARPKTLDFNVGYAP